VAGVLTLPGGNRAVLIQHGEYFSVYQNLTDITVKEGDQIKVKQVIGKSYKPATVANSEIHFEIWKSANPLPVTLDPEKWLSK
ncbi:MAG: M23 family metallopeptidase, partial [Bacteroidales bacterium]